MSKPPKQQKIMCFSTHYSNAVNSVDIRFADIQGQDLKDFLIASGHPGLASFVDRHDDRFIEVTFLLSNSEAKELVGYGFWDLDEEHWGPNAELLIEIARRFPRNVEIEDYEDCGEVGIRVSVKPIRGQGKFLKDIYLANR